VGSPAQWAKSDQVPTSIDQWVNMIIELSRIKTSPYQVRTEQHDDAIVDLAESIRQHGLLQPIKVRPTPDGYELIYGHRRVSAMRRLGWRTCEAVVEGVDDESSRLQGLIENLQRQDISSVELGEGLKKLQEDTGWTQREMAEKLSISPSSVGVALRLVDRLSDRLKPLVQSAGAGGRFVENGLSSYQAYEIAITSDQKEIQETLAEKVIREKIPHPQIREIRKALERLSPTDEEGRRRLLRTPWVKTVEEYARDAELRTQQGQSGATYSSAGDEWHQKCLWNAHRLALRGFDFYSIGYSERTSEQFLSILRAAGVRTLVDARAHPVSQFKPDFAKSNLEAALARESIAYVHMGELGVPHDRRLQLQLDQDYDSLFAWYDSNVVEKAIVRLTDPSLAMPIAVMCVELAPERCHRHRIMLALEQAGYLTFEL
jgi:ParB family chromosome partitioning protein